ncbi:MAG: hypothetical protein U0163_16945 [Gemmatimonadaceae bacterium]
MESASCSRPSIQPSPPRPITRDERARWDGYVYTRSGRVVRGSSAQARRVVVKELSFIDDGLWGFEVTDADGYVLAFSPAARCVTGR